jgi:hypothetical protein
MLSFSEFLTESYGSVAASVAKKKAEHPEHYCSHSKCLWRIADRDGNITTPCKSTKHPQPWPPKPPEKKE